MLSQYICQQLSVPDPSERYWATFQNNYPVKKRKNVSRMGCQKSFIILKQTISEDKLKYPLVDLSVSKQVVKK